MAEDKKKKDVGESFGKMMEEFGEAVARVFNDPKLKKKAKEFGRSASESGKAFGDRFKDEEVKEKFREVGKAARAFGDSITEAFREEKKDSGQEEEENNKKKIVKPLQHREESRGSRLTGYSLAIAWNIFFLVFFNFFYDYVAYYEYDAGVWTRFPVLTDDFRLWLPIFTVAVAVSIAGNILMIIIDRYIVRQVVPMVLNVFGIAAVATLLSIFPFDFDVIPPDISHILYPVAAVVLVLIIIGLSVGILVRLIKSIIHVTGTIRK